MSQQNAKRQTEEKKEEKAGAGGTTTEQKPAGTPLTKPAPGVSDASASAEDLSLLPADSEMVMGLNFAQLQQSALWKQFAPKLMEKVAGGLAEFKAACGFDPMEIEVMGLIARYHRRATPKKDHPGYGELPSGLRKAVKV